MMNTHTNKQRIAYSHDRKTAIANSANAKGITFNGVRVTVAGTRLDYAQVAIADSKHPFFGWQSEYAWSTIERAIERGVIR